MVRTHMVGEICSGCGSKLGFKRYQFRRQWKIPGAYCRDCMIKIGKDFEQSTTGTTTLPKHQCALCKNQFYFLRGAGAGAGREQYCNFCRDVIINGGPMPGAATAGRPAGGNGQKAPMPRSTMIAGGTGIALMVAGLIFTFVNTPGEGGNLVSVLFGSATTAAGFLLFRKTMQSRRVIYGLSNSKQA